LMTDACEEIADATTRMVGQVRDLMDDAAATGRVVSELVLEHSRAVDASRLDPLTGALSRTGFFAHAEKLVGAAARHAIPFTVLYVDVDRFKETNDTYGHHYGDFVLSELCSRIRQSLRKTDVLGRLGGDEFGVILNDVPEGQVRAITEALIRSVRDEPFVKGKAAVTKTISIGGLCVPGTHATHDVQALLDEADNLMYEAKRSGRKQARLRWWTKPVAPELV
jgi:diguanylate cyclase (GGDEF)-like protein